MSELPPGWCSVAIRDIGDVRLGRQRSPDRATGSHMRPYMRAANITWNGVNLDSVKEMDFSPEEFEVFGLRPGDVLVGEASGSPLEVGKSAIWRGEVPGACFQISLIRVRVGDAVLPEYLQKHLVHDARRGALAELSKGIGIHHIGAAGLAEWKISLAPLPEQKRIADKLDALLARVDACRGRLDRVPGILKRFRQSVLAAATSGELTREWREERERPTVDYELRPLRDLVREPLRNGKSVRDGDGPMVLRLSSLRNGSVDWREAKSGEWGKIDVERFLVEDGDFLVARGNGSRDLVGRGSLVLGAPPKVAFPDTMIRVRPDPKCVVPQFLKLVWDAENTRSQVEFSARTTAGIWKVAQPDLEAITVPVPALDEQAEIVRRAEELLRLADSLDARCDAARSSVGRLTPSALAKAFRGELVPQDPSDEPASKLLARLRPRPVSTGPTNKPKRGGLRGPRAKAKAYTTMLTRKDVPPAHLTTILKERGALTAEALWTASQLEIDDFYDQLKDEEARGLLRENHGDAPDAPRLLEAAA